MAGGDYLYVGKQIEPYVVKYLIATGAVELEFYGHSGLVYTLYLYGDMLFSGSSDTTIISWNVTTGEMIRQFSFHITWVQTIAVHDGVLYSAGEDKRVIKWDIINGNILLKFPYFHSNVVSCMVYRSNRLFTGSYDSRVAQWDTNTGSLLTASDGLNKKLRSLAVWKNYVISGGEDKMIRMWDGSIDSIYPFAAVDYGIYMIFSIFVEGNYLYSGGTDSIVSQRNLPDLILIKTFTGELQNPQINV